MGNIDARSLAILEADAQHKQAVRNGDIKLNSYEVKIGEKDYTAHTVFPIKWSKLLDERLDETRLTLKYLPEKVFAPLTSAQVTLKDRKGNTIILKNVVSTDEGTEVPIGSGKYNHEMMQLEETKILEGIIVDALTFTNDLGRDYANYNQPINVQKQETVVDPAVSPRPVPDETVLASIRDSGQPKKSGTVYTFPAFNKVFPNTYSNGIVVEWHRFIYENGVQRDHSFKIYDKPYPTNPVITNSDFPITLKDGEYSAIYRIDTAATNDPSGNPIAYELRLDFTFRAVSNIEPLPKWNITSVIERLLDVAEPHLEGVEPRFHLNPQQAAEFVSADFIDTPEFALPSGTLKEDLDIIGGYIHGVPRLNGNEISFDMLGGTEQARISDPKYPYITNMYSHDIENFCSSLDSTVDNFVSVLDEGQGTITEPYYDGYKTVRTETVYARIEEGNMFIATQMPIQEIETVICGIIPDTDIRGGDISPYIFESAEYGHMSSYSGQYPRSRAYALYYTQGTRNIYGLNFKIPEAAGTVFGNYAIINILEMTTGSKIGSIPYPLLAFQVTYKPAFGARVQQTKQYIGDFKQPRTLVFNQGANLIETRYYGENLKGAVARMGNADRVVTYNLADLSLIPKIGQLYGEDYYIAGVTCEMYPTFTKCMLSLSQDYNRLSQYIGINSLKRFYEVSEKQAYDRNIKYADYVVIGESMTPDTTLTTLDNVTQTFSQTNSKDRISHVIAQSVNESGREVGERVCLPVVSAALGTAMTFTYKYEDNYSAGAQAKRESAGGVSGYFTNGVEYSDYYGRFYGLKFSMKEKQARPLTDFQQSSIGLALPITSLSPDSPVIGTTNPLVIRKDGAEIISFTYVLEFVTNKRNYIIGSALARNCPLVRGNDKTKKAALYVIPKRISKFAARVSLSGATKLTDYSLGGITEGPASAPKEGKFEDVIPHVSGEAWAIVVESTGELLLGSNEKIMAGQTIQMPYLTLRHNIY